MSGEEVKNVESVWRVYGEFLDYSKFIESGEGDFLYSIRSWVVVGCYWFGLGIRWDLCF